MSGMQELQIACPQCNYSNTATPPIAKYKEVVYQLCDDNEGQGDHNICDRIKCDNCHNQFDFYWCAGHTIIEGAGELRRLDHDVKWPQLITFNKCNVIEQFT